MNIQELTRRGEAIKKILRIPMNLIGKITIKSKDNNKRVIGGYANIAVIDSQNQLIPVETLRKGLETLITDPDYANLMLVHKNIQIGKILPEYGDLKTHVDDKGLYIVSKIRDDIEIANQVWESILKGDINGFSIGCEVLDSHSKCDLLGKNCIEILDRINIFEISVCNFPVNSLSGFVVISKSKYQEDMLGLIKDNDVCKGCGIDSDMMSEENKTEETKDVSSEEEIIKEDEKTEKVELSVNERIENMERTIFNLEATINKLSEILSATKKEENVEAEKKTDEPEVKDEEKNEEKPKEEIKSDAFVTKDDYDSLKKSIESFKDELVKSINDKFTDLFKAKEEEADVDELKLAIKARDDQIEALNKKISVLTKSEEKKAESKTVHDETKSEDETIETVDYGNVVIKDGTVSYRNFM